MRIKRENNGSKHFQKQGDEKMSNIIIEQTINRVVDSSNYSSEFKSVFKKYIKNVFDNNARGDDLKRALSLIEGEEE